MTNILDDIFTEPEDVDPDTLANLGPLRRLAGIWEGRKGVDLNPKAEGPERKEFTERIELQPTDYQTEWAAALLRPAISHPHTVPGRGRHLP